jgi:hypothetical protein
MNNDEFTSLLFRHKVLLVTPGARAYDAPALFESSGLVQTRNMPGPKPQDLAIRARP